jgi:hypothetical protein
VELRQVHQNLEGAQATLPQKPMEALFSAFVLGFACADDSHFLVCCTPGNVKSHLADGDAEDSTPANDWRESLLHSKPWRGHFECNRLIASVMNSGVYFAKVVTSSLRGDSDAQIFTLALRNRYEYVVVGPENS